MKAEMTRQRRLYPRRLVHAVVIEHQVELWPPGDTLLDPLQETQKLLIPVSPLAVAHHPIAGHVEGGKQRGQPGPLVNHASGAAEPWRQKQRGYVPFSACT